MSSRVLLNFSLPNPLHCYTFHTTSGGCVPRLFPFCVDRPALLPTTIVRRTDLLEIGMDRAALLRKVLFRWPLYNSGRTGNNPPTGSPFPHRGLRPLRVGGCPGAKVFLPGCLQIGECWRVTNFSNDEWRMGALSLGFLGEVKGRPKRQDWKTDGTDGTDKNGFCRLRRVGMSRRWVKVRFYPFGPFNPFYNPVVFSKKEEKP